MSNLLKGLASLAALILAALSISQMASQPNPPPLLVWAIDQFNYATANLGPFWAEVRQIQKPESVFFFAYLWYFLLRGSWDIWKIWLIGGAIISVIVGVAVWILEDDFFEEIVGATMTTFLSIVIIKGLLVCGRYIWLLFDYSFS